MIRGRWRAGVAALSLILAGGLLGVAGDRLWLRHSHGSDSALTADALVAHLDLRPAAEARMRALLDSLHVEIAATAHQAHERLDAALPEDTRPVFRQWMEHHHRAMLRRLGGD